METESLLSLKPLDPEPDGPEGGFFFSFSIFEIEREKKEQLS